MTRPTPAEDLLEAVLAAALARANLVLDTDALAAAPEALGQLIRSSWRVLDQYGRLRAAAQRDLSPSQLRRHHDCALARVTHLVDRGQEDGDFRTGLPATSPPSTAPCTPPPKRSTPAGSPTTARRTCWKQRSSRH